MSSLGAYTLSRVAKKKQRHMSPAMKLRASEKARRDLERTKRLIESSASSGTANHGTLASRGFVVSREGGERIPSSTATPQGKKRGRKLGKAKPRKIG